MPTIPTQHAKNAETRYTRQAIAAAHDLAEAANDYAASLERGGSPIGDLTRISLLSDLVKAKLSNIITIRQLINTRHDGQPVDVPVAYTTSVTMESGQIIEPAPVAVNEPETWDI